MRTLSLASLFLALAAPSFAGEVPAPSGPVIVDPAARFALLFTRTADPERGLTRERKRLASSPTTAGSRTG